MAHNHPSPEEEPQHNDKRARDVQTLTRLLEKLNMYVIDDAFERSASGIISWELYYTYIGFTAQVESSAFQLIDKELDSQVRTLYDAWLRVFSYGLYFDPRPEYLRFIAPHMADDQADVIQARENFDEDFIRFHDAYRSFIEYVKDQYAEEIDLRKTNQVAQDSFPPPPQISEEEELGETETEEPATAQPEKESAPFNWNSCYSWIKRIGAFFVGLAAVAGCLIMIIPVLYGEGLCSQQNPPKAFQRVLPLVCPKDPDPGEEPAVSVTLTSTSTATETPTIMFTPTQIPSSTPEPTSTATGSAATSRSPCIRADSGYWYASWITYTGTQEPQVSRKHDNLNCYDFDSKGFFALYHSENDTWRLRISCGGEGVRCPDTDVLRGLYTFLPFGEYEFNILIEEIEIINETQSVNDVDLILGLGDPKISDGIFIIFRLVNKSGNIHICELDGFNYHCDPVSKADPREFGLYTAKFEIGEQSSISLDDLSFGSITADDPNHNKLWIGFSIRSEGLIDAIVEFPPSLSDFLSIVQ